MKSTQGQPLVRVNTYIFQAQYDEVGREAVKKVLQDYEGTAASLNTFDINGSESIRGSNIYSRFALANAYREITGEDIRPINC